MKRGECVGIVGRNGAGKTTLLQVLCGITQPTRGAVSVNGRLAPILALGAAFDGSLTGRENAMIGCAILGLKRKEIDARLQSIVDFAEIGMFFDQPMKLYSSGMVARLAFAICAHVDADILIVDEALSVGDEFFAEKCQRFIDDFAKRGTIIVVSHGLDYLDEHLRPHDVDRRGPRARDGRPEDGHRELSRDRRAPRTRIAEDEAA